jgi:hypothetical protein
MRYTVRTRTNYLRRPIADLSGLYIYIYIYIYIVCPDEVNDFYQVI